MAGEQELGKLVLKLVAEVSDLKKGLQGASDQIGKFSKDQQKQTEGFGASIGAIKTAYLGYAAAVYSAWKMIMKAFDWAELGAKALAVEESFSLITKSMMVNGDHLAKKIKEVSFVFVDQTDLMVKAQRLLIEGLSSAQIVKLMEASRVAARLMGTDVTAAFEKISEAVITLRTRGLKAAFPMDVAEVTDRYARSLGTVTKYLSEAGQRQAIVNEIVRQSQEKVKLLGGELHPNLSEKIQRVKSGWAEMKEVIGKELGAQIEPVITALSDMITMIERAQKSWMTLPDTVKLAIREMAIAATGTIPLIGPFIQAAIRRAQFQELAKTPEVRTGEYRERARQDLAGISTEEAKARGQKLIDERKLLDDLTKFRLANEEQMAVATGEIQMQILSERKVRAVSAQKAISEDTFLLEQYYDKLIAQQNLRNSLSLLNVKEKTEIEAAQQMGMDENSVRLKYVQERYAVIQKFITDTGKLEAAQAEMIGEAQRKAAQAATGFTFEEQPFAPTLEQIAEMEKRSVDVMVERDKWQAEYLSQLAEVTGDYDGIIAAQTRSLEVEREAFKTSETYWKLSLDQQKQYNDLMNARIAKAKQVKDLENLRDIAEWRKEIGELTGNWTMAKDAEIQALAVEREYLLTTKALTPEMRTYVNELYNLKTAEIEARKNMDALGLSVIGFQKYIIQTKNELADMWENALPNMMRSYWDEFENYLKTGKMSWANFTESLKNQWAASVRKTLEAGFADLYQKGISGLGKLFGVEIKGAAKPLTSQEKTNVALDAMKVSTEQLKISNEQLKTVDEQLRTTNEALKTEVITLTSAIRGLPSSIQGQSPTTTGEITGEMTQAEIAMAWPEAVQDGAKKSSDSVDKMYKDMGKSAQTSVNGITDSFGALANTGVSVVMTIAGLLASIFGGSSSGSKAPKWPGIVMGIVNLISGALGKVNWGSLFSSSTSSTYSAGEMNQMTWLQRGGPVQGPGGIDAVSIRATAGEFVHSVPAVRHYGESIMAAINARMIPRDVLLPYAYESTLRPAHAYQTGGMVTENAVSVGPINVNDPRLASHMRGAIEQTVIDVLKRFSR